LALTVGLIEWLVQVSDRMTGGWVLWVHLGFVIPFAVIIILLKTKITGEKNRPLHKKLAYTAVWLFIPGLILGVYLLFK